MSFIEPRKQVNCDNYECEYNKDDVCTQQLIELNNEGFCVTFKLVKLQV